jgi:hypothetical protein
MNKLNSINNTFESYQQLIHFFQDNKDKVFDNVHVELRYFFAANMSAALGAVLDLFTKNFNDIYFDYMSPQIENRIILTISILIT